jgi:hypothetical protein
MFLTKLYYLHIYYVLHIMFLTKLYYLRIYYVLHMRGLTHTIRVILHLPALNLM